MAKSGYRPFDRGVRPFEPVREKESQVTREPKKPSSDEFAEQAKGSRSNLIKEFFAFIVEGKKWWLTPIIVMLLLLGLFIILGGTAAAPFIYTLF